MAEVVRWTVLAHPATGGAPHYALLDRLLQTARALSAENVDDPHEKLITRRRLIHEMVHLGEIVGAEDTGYYPVATRFVSLGEGAVQYIVSGSAVLAQVRREFGHADASGAMRVIARRHVPASSEVLTFEQWLGATTVDRDWRRWTERFEREVAAGLAPMPADDLASWFVFHPEPQRRQWIALSDLSRPLPGLRLCRQAFAVKNGKGEYSYIAARLALRSGRVTITSARTIERDNVRRWRAAIRQRESNPEIAELSETGSAFSLRLRIDAIPATERRIQGLAYERGVREKGGVGTLVFHVAVKSMVVSALQTAGIEVRA